MKDKYVKFHMPNIGMDGVGKVIQDLGDRLVVRVNDSSLVCYVLKKNARVIKC